jgi:MFS family permease
MAFSSVPLIVSPDPDASDPASLNGLTFCWRRLLSSDAIRTIAEMIMKTGIMNSSIAANAYGLRGILAVCSATILMALGFGALGLTSVFMMPLEAEFGWSRSETSLVYAIATIGMALGGLYWGRLSDKRDIRILLLIGASGMVVALLLMASVQALWQIYLASVMLGGFGFAVLYAPLVGAPGEWFPNRRGLVTGIVTAGGALGQGALPFVASYLIDQIGWRLAYASIAIAMLAILAIALPFIRWPTGNTAFASGLAVQSVGMSPRQRRQLALLAMAAFLCCTCMGVPLVHLVSFVGMVCGSPATGAASLLVAMICGAIGRVCFGFFADRTGALDSYAVASAIQTLCVVTYPLLSDSLSLLALSALFGFGFAGNMTCLVLCVRETVPSDRFGGAIGIVMLVAWAGMGFGSYLGGWLFDMYLSYSLAFALAGLAGILNLLMIYIIRYMRRGEAGKSAPIVCLTALPST